MRNNFQLYIVRLLKASCPDTRITKTALEAADSMIRLLTDKLTETSIALTMNSEKKTISKDEISTSCHLLLPQFIADINTLSQKSIEQWNASETVSGKLQTRESRCGLVFSVSLCEKYLRRFGNSNLHVSSESPIYLASALQVVTSRLLTSVESITKESKKITMTVRHLFLSVSKDFSVFSKLGFVFLEGGVEPEELPQRSQSRTISEIKKLQKTGDMLMQHAPFNNLVREILPEGFRLTADFCSTFQCFIEHDLVGLMKNANTLALHAGRETVYERDVSLASTRNYDKHTVNTKIPEAALRHMALRAGIKRFGECSAEAYRNYMIDLLKDLLESIHICANYHDVKTINRKILLEVLQMRGIHLSIIPKGRKVNTTTNRTISSTN
jgi:histone H3/H4